MNIKMIMIGLIGTFGLFNSELVFGLKSKKITSKTTLSIVRGDITKMNVDAIVNAANDRLAGGSGVCGAIFKAAGSRRLQKACNAYKPQAGRSVRCSVGQARITPSFQLATSGIKHIIHAVGPDCRIITDFKKQDTLLAQAYKSSLRLADQAKLSSIAFPFISSGIYGFPKERAAKIALASICDYIAKHKDTTTLTDIRVVLFSNKDVNVFIEKLKK